MNESDSRAVLNFVSTSTVSTLTLAGGSHHQIRWPSDEEVTMVLRYVCGNISVASPPTLAGASAPLGMYLRMLNTGPTLERFYVQENHHRGIFVPFLNVTTLSTNAFCNRVSSLFPSGLAIGHFHGKTSPRDWKLELFDESGAPLSFTQCNIRIELISKSGIYLRAGDD